MMLKCPNCGNQKIDDTYTKAPGGKEVRGHHYFCSKCNFEWQSRSVKRYRKRITESKDLLTLLFAKRSLLSSQDRFFIEKSYAQQKSSLKYRSRFLRIANKIGLDLRDLPDELVNDLNNLKFGFENSKSGSRLFRLKQKYREIE